MSLKNNVRKKCILCGGSGFKYPFGESHFLVKCKNCGMVSSGIIPTDDELLSYYDKYPSYETVSALTLNRYNEILDMLEGFRSTNHLPESGCGFGFFLEEARKRNWIVKGVELSHSALAECRRKDI